MVRVQTCMVSRKIAQTAAGNTALEKTWSELRLQLDSLKHLLENDEEDRMPGALAIQCF